MGRSNMIGGGALVLKRADSREGMDDVSHTTTLVADAVEALPARVHSWSMSDE